MASENILGSVWQTPERSPILKNNEIHIWRANLELSASEVECLATTLSEPEIARANRFRFPQDQRRFIVARGILRQLLGNYLALAPSRVTFAYADRGKPFLASAQDNALQFNISHSQAYALLGFSHEHFIGVDLERERPMPDALKLAQRFFSASEFKMLENTAEDDRATLFFRLWTAKEAYLKAVGTGLSDLANVEIAFDRRQHPYVQYSSKQNHAAWSLYSCTPATNYLGAIAVQTDLSASRIHFWQWQPNFCFTPVPPSD